MRQIAVLGLASGLLVAAPPAPATGARATLAPATVQAAPATAARTTAATSAAAGAVQAMAGSVPGAFRVSMKDFAYAPVSITIHAGQAVVWTYDESATDPMPNCETVVLQIPGSPVQCPGHSTTADATGPGGTPLWDSGVKRAAGFPYSVRFLTPGTYPYHCTVHGGKNPNNPVTHMNGTVVVLAAAATATPAPAPAAPAPAPTPATTGTPTNAGAALPSTGGSPGRARTGFTLLLAGGLATLLRRGRRGRPLRRGRSA